MSAATQSSPVAIDRSVGATQTDSELSLNVAKPAITRAVDRLELFDLAERRSDPWDRRSVLMAPTKSGRAFVKELGEMMRAASKPRSVVLADVKARISAQCESGADSESARQALVKLRVSA